MTRRGKGHSPAGAIGRRRTRQSRSLRRLIWQKFRRKNTLWARLIAEELTLNADCLGGANSDWKLGGGSLFVACETALRRLIRAGLRLSRRALVWTGRFLRK